MHSYRERLPQRALGFGGLCPRLSRKCPRNVGSADVEWSHWPEVGSIHTETECGYENGNQHWSMVGRHAESVPWRSLRSIGIAILAVDIEKIFGIPECFRVDTVSLVAHP